MRRVVPWSSKEEWSQVYEYLYSSDSNLQRVGVNRVKAWTSRGRLPHAVECTSTLIEAHLQDSLNIISPLSDRELSNLYAIYLIRFVNGFIDSAQKGNFASSATAIAEQLGLPIWFVEIRHQCTHEKIPNLPYLRKCSSQALSWLRERYWEVQAHALEDAYKHTISLINEYMDVSQQDQTSRGGKLVGNITSTLSKDSYPEILLPILLDKLEKGFNTKLWTFFVSQCASAWSDDFMENLLLALLDEVFTRESETLSKWLEYYIQQSAENLEKQQVEELISKCLQNENQQSYDLLIAIQKVTGLPESNTHQLFLFQCLGKKLALSLSRDPVESLMPFDHEEAQRTIDQLKENLQKMNSESIAILEDGVSAKDAIAGGWTLESDWQPCPIGCLPGSSNIPNLDLDPSFENMGWLSSQGIIQIPMPRQVITLPTTNAKEEKEIIKLF